MAKQTGKITILSHPDDVHAKLIRAYLEQRHRLTVDCLTVSSAASTFTLRYGKELRSSCSYATDLVWIRRRRMLRVDAADPGDIDMQINIEESNETVIQDFLLRNADRCINHPVSAARVENKATQLRLAKDAGLNIPATIISSDYKEIVAFSARHSAVVIKNLRPLGYSPTGTFDLDPSTLSEASCLRSHAIYQEKIEGSTHYRIVVLGEAVHGFRYRSASTDSRFDTRDHAEYVRLETSTESDITRFMRTAGLRMGVFDFKEDRHGDMYFLEVNQQGAFAYLDPLSSFPIVRHSADFIAVERIKYACS
jgi:hypothetical protein